MLKVLCVLQGKVRFLGFDSVAVVTGCTWGGGEELGSVLPSVPFVKDGCCREVSTIQHLWIDKRKEES